MADTISVSAAGLDSMACTFAYLNMYVQGPDAYRPVHTATAPIGRSDIAVAPGIGVRHEPAPAPPGFACGPDGIASPRPGVGAVAARARQSPARGWISDLGG
nr:hypothetical protein GCM10020063_055620 [Dactylosporangium thailandense]